ncbi:hypothetical protein [Streptomyces sp. NPDC051569]|uniref:hypothetical protein n=1 Tax=Streptomyces sp. NPDC051569 TaxID=3365661 RepID=UPI0037A861A9
MIESSVPLPPASVPDGTPAWSTPDAARWAALRPEAWARPVWPASALFLAVALRIAVEPGAACTDASPCGPDWWGVIQMGLFLAQFAWFLVLPELTLLSAPLLAVCAIAQGPLTIGTATGRADAFIVVALGFGWIAALRRLAVRKEQRLSARGAATGVRQGLPLPLPPFRRGLIALGAGLALCAVAGAAVILALRGIHEDEARAARATPVRAEVVGRGEESIRVRMPDGLRSIGAGFPEDYATGDHVTLLVSGDWRRLATEPYDAFGWQLLIIAAAVPGLSLLAVGALARGRSAALRRRPVPVLRVLERLDRNANTRVYAADDRLGNWPLFVFPAIADLPKKDREESRDDDHEPEYDTRLHEAVMYGSPREGGELVLATTTQDGSPLTIRSAGRIRNSRHIPKPSADSRRARSRRARSLRARQDLALVHRTAASMEPTVRPVRWKGRRRSRCAALPFALLLAGQVFWLPSELTTGDYFHAALALLAPLFTISMTAGSFNWRITADASGLWLTHAWGVRHVPWEELTAVIHGGRHSSIRVVGTREPSPLLRTPCWPWLERRLKNPPCHVRAVEEINAMRVHPELRPTGESAPRERGRPAGPVLVVLCALGVAAQFLL